MDARERLAIQFDGLKNEFGNDRAPLGETGLVEGNVREGRGAAVRGRYLGLKQFVSTVPESKGTPEQGFHDRHGHGRGHHRRCRGRERPQGC